MKALLAIAGLAFAALLLTFLGLTRWSKISREALVEQYRLESAA